MRLKDKTAIVTGAGSGFGKGIAMRFAKEGARVGVIDINAEAAREVASQIGNSAFAMEADVSIDGDVSRMVQEALAVGDNSISWSTMPVRLTATNR